MSTTAKDLQWSDLLPTDAEFKRQQLQKREQEQALALHIALDKLKFDLVPVMSNPNCDGSGPHHGQQVRVLPVTKGPNGSNAILCWNCFLNELRWRKERNKDLAKDCQFDLPRWHSLKVYNV